MKIRITKPIYGLQKIEVGDVYEVLGDFGGDFVINAGGDKVLVSSGECEVLEECEEDLYQITFVSKDSELNFVGVGSPRVEGLDVYIMSPDNKQAVVDKSKFLYFVIEPYSED